jgi:hypothetical protein
LSQQEICVYGATCRKQADAWSLLRTTFINSCGFAAGFVDAVMKDVAACRITQLQRDTKAGFTLWVTFKNASAKQACWKSRHHAAHYSSSHGQRCVRFTQSLTEQQRQEVDSFKEVMNIAADMEKKVELLYFPVVQLRIDNSYASSPEEAAVILL